jgi:hypothetical protein
MRSSVAKQWQGELLKLIIFHGRLQELLVVVEWLRGVYKVSRLKSIGDV